MNAIEAGRCISESLELSVVVPCYNENQHIETVLTDWIHELRDLKISFEILVVNDGSLDGTGRVLDKLRKENREMRVVHQLNTGHSRACRRGYESARGRFILTVDSNGRYEPSDFPALWENRENHLLVLAQRTHRLDGWISRFFTGYLRALATHLFGVKVQDPNVPFRLFLREPVLRLLKDAPNSTESIHWTMSVLVAREFPGQVAETKVPYRHRLQGQNSPRLMSLIQLATHYWLEAMALRTGLFKKSKKKSGLLQTQAA